MLAIQWAALRKEFGPEVRVSINDGNDLNSGPRPVWGNFELPDTTYGNFEVSVEGEIRVGVDGNLKQEADAIRADERQMRREREADQMESMRRAGYR